MLTATESSRHPSPVSHEDQDAISFLDLLTPLVRRWPLVVLTALGFGVTTALVVLFLPPLYTATTTFVPETPKESSLGSSLGGLASQFGLGLEVADPYSADFIAKVLQSRHLREAILLTEFGRRPLLDLLETEGKTPSQRMENGLEALDDATSISVEQRTGIVSLSVMLKGPELASAVANRMVEELNRFNVERRRSQSGEERMFAERRLAEARSELAAAEDNLVRFLQRNRQFSDFSLAGVEERRLERDVQLKQEVLLTLSRSYEEARIDEVRDTPVLTVIDKAEPPARKSWPRRTLSVIAAVFIGVVAGMALAYLAEARSRVRRETRPDYRAFLAAVGEAKQRLGLHRDRLPTDVG